MSVASPPETSTPSQAKQWSPRFWLGSTFFVFLTLLAKNRFAVGWRYWPIAVADAFFAVFNSFMGLAQRAIFGRRIRSTRIEHPPVFVIGHWRTGTTMLHELFCLDDRLACPTTYQCFSPHHFLLTEGLAQRFLKFLLPSRRPMDNMPMGWDRPQEDEFALCNLGAPSPYWTVAFPNRPPQHGDYLTLESVSEPALCRWREKLSWFFKCVTLKRQGRRLVLKSPTHTCRVKTLMEMFPDARFIYLVRDPRRLFPSTLRLWKSLYEAHGYQRPRLAGLEDYVLETFSRLHESFEESRGLIPPGRLFELRYEDLVGDPVGQLRAIYEQLDLGDFEAVRAKVEEYTMGVKDYQVNRHQLTESQRERVEREWAGYLRQHGYSHQ